MMRVATVIANALGLTGGTRGQAGEFAAVQAGESACPRDESEKSRAVDQAGHVQTMARARTKRRSLPARVRKGDSAMLSDFMVWLHENDVSGEIRACDLFRCHCEFAQEVGAAALTPRQLAIALGVLGIAKRRLRVRDRSTGRVTKLPTGVPVRVTRYTIPDQPAAHSLPAESACASEVSAEIQNTTGASAILERAA